MNRLIVQALAAGALLAAATAGAAATPRTESQTFVMGTGLFNLYPSFAPEALGIADPGIPNTGGAGFELQPGDAWVDIAVVSEDGLVPRASYVFTDAAGERITEYADFCASATGVPVPPEAHGLVVYAGALLLPDFPCEGEPATALGHVTATFS